MMVDASRAKRLGPPRIVRKRSFIHVHYIPNSCCIQIHDYCTDCTWKLCRSYKLGRSVRVQNQRKLMMRRGTFQRTAGSVFDSIFNRVQPSLWCGRKCCPKIQMLKQGAGNRVACVQWLVKIV